MKIPYYKALLAICLATIMSVHVYAQNKEAGFPLAPYFSPGTTDVMYPDDEGSYGVGYCLNLLTSLTAAILYLQTVIFAKHLLPNTFPSSSPYCPKTVTK